MITCIKCRQEYSEQDHQCLEEMTLEELWDTLPPSLRGVARDIQEKSERYLRSLFLDTATGEELERLDVMLAPGDGDGQCPASGLFDHDPVE